MLKSLIHVFVFAYTYTQYTDELSVVCGARDIFENWNYTQDGMVPTHQEPPEGDCRVMPGFCHSQSVPVV